MSEDDTAPKKRYRVFIEADVHDGLHLAHMVLGWTRGGADLYKLRKGDRPPWLSSGGGYSFRYEENDDWVQEELYDDALSEWFKRTRTNAAPTDG